MNFPPLQTPAENIPRKDSSSHQDILTALKHFQQEMRQEMELLKQSCHRESGSGQQIIQQNQDSSKNGMILNTRVFQ